MCNLYSMTKSRTAIVKIIGAMSDRTANEPPLPSIFPDYPAPIIRATADGKREIVNARWGMPTPPQFLKTRTGAPKKTDPGVTNVRNLKSPHWRRWLGVEHRCLVPFTAFSEPPASGGAPDNWTWFALTREEKLGFFAGIWTGWTSVRKIKEGEVTGDIFAFLTTAPNGVVGEVHSKAMPVILTEPAEWDAWLSAEPAEALKLQRPLPDTALEVVPRPEK